MMLQAKQINLKATLESSSIMVWKECAFSSFVFNFKLMYMVELNVSLHN
jgi:hypothetical protein